MTAVRVNHDQLLEQGRELGIEPRIGESWRAFAKRVRQASESRKKIAGIALHVDWKMRAAGPDR